MKRAEILKQRELHRGDPQEFVLNFVVNYSAPARLMHSFLPKTTGKEDIFQAAIRANIIGIASCVETFFRDLNFYLLKSKPWLLQKALKENSLREPASHLPRYLAEGVSAEEFAAFQPSFQSTEAIDKNISIFFSTPFFETLDQFEPICEIPSAPRGDRPA
jgi:hypothetical protein